MKIVLFSVICSVAAVYFLRKYLKGPQGPAGPIGAMGLIGSKGEIGLTGPSGEYSKEQIEEFVADVICKELPKTETKDTLSPAYRVRAYLLALTAKR